MKRITIRMTEAQIDEVEELVEEGKYPNRSEAIRTAVRDLLDCRERRLRKYPGYGYPGRAQTDGGHGRLP